MPSSVTLSAKDYSGASSRCTFNVTTIDATNIDQFVGTDLPALVAAINAVTLHDLTGQQVKVVDTPPGAKASVKQAQREQKWLVTYSFTNNSVPGTGRIEIPIADPAPLSSDTENMDLSAGVGLTLKTQLEAQVLSKYGDAITVESVKLVGRNI